MYHHRRRVVQVAAVFVAHDVGAQQFVMLSSSSDHQQPQKKRRGSILLEPVPATGSGSASSSVTTHISGVQNLHTEFLLSCMTVSARKRARGSEHMETKTMKREDDRSRLIVLLSITKATAIVPVAPPPAELFSPGQSVLQWWASWFKGCIELPKQYCKRFKRPTWFSGEVSATKKAPAPTKTVEPSSQLICSLGALLASEGRQSSGMDVRQLLRWLLRDLLVPCPLMERNP